MAQKLSVVAERYFKGEFIVDLIILIPFGMLEFINPKLKVLWLVKDIRLKDLSIYISKGYINPIINNFIKYRQNKALDDEKKINEINEDFIYIS